MYVTPSEWQYFLAVSVCSRPREGVVVPRRRGQEGIHRHQHAPRPDVAIGRFPRAAHARAKRTHRVRGARRPRQGDAQHDRRPAARTGSPRRRQDAAVAQGPADVHEAAAEHPRQGGTVHQVSWKRAHVCSHVLAGGSDDVWLVFMATFLFTALGKSVKKSAIGLAKKDLLCEIM